MSARCAVLLLACFTPSLTLARIPALPPFIEIQPMAEEAPIVFRGEVLIVTPVGENPNPLFSTHAKAWFAIDRCYKRCPIVSPDLQFAFSCLLKTNGHDCIDFKPGTAWVVLAVQKYDALELIHDCEGALHVSCLLGQPIQGSNMLARMQADFAAGLSGPAPAARIQSTQRLGNLGLPSSSALLRQVLSTGSEEERNRAVLGCLIRGDSPVLGMAQQIVSGRPPGQLPSYSPVWSISAELGRRNRQAVAEPRRASQ